jgi:hypothetical protein
VRLLQLHNRAQAASRQVECLQPNTTARTCRNTQCETGLPGGVGREGSADLDARVQSEHGAGTGVAARDDLRTGAEGPQQGDRMVAGVAGNVEDGLRAGAADRKCQLRIRRTAAARNMSLVANSVLNLELAARKVNRDVLIRRKILEQVQRDLKTQSVIVAVEAELDRTHVYGDDHLVHVSTKSRNIHPVELARAILKVADGIGPFELAVHLTRLAAWMTDIREQPQVF